MSAANPKKAVAALLPAAIDCGDGVRVKPVTLAVYALLESINSPFLDGRKAGTLELLPSLFIVTHEPGECLGEDIAAKVLQWSDTLDAGALQRINNALAEQVRRILDVARQGAGAVKKKGTMDGSPR